MVPEPIRMPPDLNDACAHPHGRRHTRRIGPRDLAADVLALGTATYCEYRALTDANLGWLLVGLTFAWLSSLDLWRAWRISTTLVRRGVEVPSAPPRRARRSRAG